MSTALTARIEGWQARLEAGFRDDGARTRLTGLSHRGPLRVQHPFYPEPGGVCHLYLLHPPGGLVGGDDLQMKFDVHQDGQALVTTPSATKIYRSDGAWATQRSRLAVAPGGALEWLPQETLAFDGCRGRLQTDIDLADGARFLGWEMVALGRTFAAEAFEAGELRLNLSLSRRGVPLLVERGLFDAQTLGGIWGLRGSPAYGTVLAAPADERALRIARGLIATFTENILAAASLWRDMLVLRAWAPGMLALRAAFEAFWHGLRPAVIGRRPCTPRIWRT